MTTQHETVMHCCIGIIKAINDPLQMLRARIFCPALDNEFFVIDELPWANYAPPFGGGAANMARGATESKTEGAIAYGLFNSPQEGAQVLVWYMAGDPSFRIYANSLMPAQTNRSFPLGRNLNESGAVGAWSDTGKPMEPTTSNAKAAGLAGDTTRGLYERQIAQAQTEKDGKDGYSADKSKNDGSLTPQTYGWTTPDGHMFVMQGAAEHCRMRLRTVGGNQIILDDTNERIYISTLSGKSWIELDADGHIHMHAGASFSINAGGDINLNAGGKINAKSGKGINIKTGASINIDAGAGLDAKAGAAIKVSAGSELHASGGSAIIMSAPSVTITSAGAGMALGGSASLSGDTVAIDGGMTYINSGKSSTGGSASPAGGAGSPSVVPGFEPWTRPGSASQRNKNWKAR